jgi:peptidoglycan/LPS O-acetylase OafA/YrhL
MNKSRAGSPREWSVSLFYLLSGFVMAWVDRPTDTAWLFYRRRFARIYPAYFVAVTAAVTIAVAGGYFVWTDLAAYTLLQGWLPSESIYLAANAVFWSLSCEAFFYLAFPAIRRLTRRLTPRGLWALTIGAGTCSITIGVVGSFFEQSEFLSWAVVAFPPARLPEFVIGVTLGSLMVRGWRPVLPVWIPFALSALAVAAATLAPYALSRYAVTLIPFAMLVVALATADLRGVKLFTQWPWVVKLGVWSYCFYLVHFMVMQRIEGFSDRLGIPPIVSIALALPAALVAAWLLHILVERPAERSLRPRGPSRIDNDAATPVTT